VDVYKSSNADQLEGGLGGYVNVRTRRPFDFDGLTIAASAKETYYDRMPGFDDKLKPTLSGLISNRWETGMGEIGALLNVSYGETAFTQDRAAIDQVTVPPVANFGGSGQTVTSPAVAFLNATQTGTHERRTIVGSLQWKPSDSLNLYADAYYVDYTRIEYFADYRLGFLGTPTATFTLFPDSSDLSSGSFTNSTVNSATAYGDEFRTTQQYAIGGDWNNGDALTIKADLSRTTSDNDATLEEYDMSTTIPGVDFSIDRRGNQSVAVSGIDIANPASYKPVYLLSILLGGVQHANTGKLEANYEVGGFLKSIDVGLRYSEYVAKNEGYVNFYCINDTFAGSAPCGGGAQTSADIPANFIKIYPSIAGSFVGWNSEEMRQFTDMRAFFGLPTSESLQNSQYLRNREETTAFYAKLNYSVNLGSKSFDGNIGGRFIHTALNSDAYGTDAVGASVLQHKASSRNDVLPTFNGRLKFSDTISLRVAAGKSLERIPFGDLSAATIITNQAQHEARSGNPELEPFTSENFDVSLESYFSETGLAYLAGFRKKVEGYLQTVTVEESLNGETYRVTKHINGGKGTIEGFELGVQTFFDFLPGAFNGFGLQANYTFVDSSVPSPVEGAEPVDLEGLARHSYNLIGLYEKGPLSARLAYSWRDKLVTSSAPFGGDGQPNFAESLGVLDFSVGFDINKNFAISVDGANILGAKDRGYRFSRQSLPTGNLYIDRRFGIQARYKF
jgi:TonB-dependent receptor